MGKNIQLVFNTYIIGKGKFSTQLVSVILLPIYTSILSTTEYGTYDLINTIVIFLMPVITLLLDESMFRFIIDAETKEEKKNIISQTFIYSIFSTMIFSIIIILIGFIFKFKVIELIIFLVSNILVRIKECIC